MTNNIDYIIFIIFVIFIIFINKKYKGNASFVRSEVSALAFSAGGGASCENDPKFTGRGLAYNTGAYKFLQPITNTEQNDDITSALFNYLVDRRTFSPVARHPDLGLYF